MGWSAEKTLAWFTAPNPMLGGWTPEQMLHAGRAHRLEAFIAEAEQVSRQIVPPSENDGKSMHQLVIYGSSDDLVEVEGDIIEEFSHYSEEPAYLGVSDGTMLQVTYGQDGTWTIKPYATGEGTTVEIQTANGEDNYSDRVTLKSERPFEFVTFGKGKRRSRP
jgi:hypothetical protein